MDSIEAMELQALRLASYATVVLGIEPTSAQLHGLMEGFRVAAEGGLALAITAPEWAQAHWLAITDHRHHLVEGARHIIEAAPLAVTQ